MVLTRTQKYGGPIRKLVDAALRSKQAKYDCPHCGKRNVKRAMYSVWKCRSCNSTFAGAAYSLTTEAGGISSRLISEYKKL